MTLLGIETATDVCSAALVSGSSLVGEEWVERKSVHAERLLPMIESLLKKGGKTPADLDAVAVSIGPGSFTGLRIGLSSAKGLVIATGAVLVAVPTLEALALRAGPMAEPGERILALLDARRDEVYCQMFEVKGGRVVPCWEPRDATLSDLAGLAGEAKLLLTGEAREKARVVFGARGAAVRIAAEDVARCSAVSVVSIGLRRAAQGEKEDPATLEPRYIKEFFLRSGTPTPGA